MHFHAGVQQHVREFPRGQRVVLRHGDRVGLDLALRAAFGLTDAFEIHVPEDDLAVARGEIDGRPGGNLLLLDDVANAPPAAGPDARHVGLRLVLGKIPRSAAELVGMDVDRCRQPRARRFGQHAGDVVERRDPVKAHVPPAGIDRVANHAGLAASLEPVAHVRAPPRDLTPHQRIAVRRIGSA